MFRIDGSYGEGGGQILRSALALSLVLNQEIEIFNIRAKRKKPGLQAQHLTCLKAAQEISKAEVRGAEINSENLFFSPKEIKSKEYFFDIGTAGSTSLVFQTLLLPLSFTKKESKITIIGGTHNPLSPNFHYLKFVFLPTLEKLGIKVEANLEKYGFYPKGGGKVIFLIKPSKKILVRDFLERGELKRVFGFSGVSRLDFNIAKRQRNRALEILSRVVKPRFYYPVRHFQPEIKLEEIKALSQGTFFFLCAEFANVLAGFSSLGKKGKPAEKVGEEACLDFLDYFNSNKALDPNLADQIILYLALAKEKSSFTTSKISSHLLTHIWLLKQFLTKEIKIFEKEKKIIIE